MAMHHTTAPSRGSFRARPLASPARRALLKAAAVAAACLPARGLFAQLTGPGGDACSRPGPDLDALVGLIRTTPRARVVEEIGARVRAGLDDRRLLAALLYAGVTDIEPRPVGYKFHAVMALYSAHRAAAARGLGRWLPLFWALDYFKAAQARDAAGGDWRLGQVPGHRLPDPGHARAELVAAMEAWDAEAADRAASALARSAGPREAFDLMCRYGARDYRAIGHKAIYLANGWRTLAASGETDLEPVLRSMVYAFLAHDGANPAGRDDPADRPWRRHLERAGTIRAGWEHGRIDAGATLAMLALARDGSEAEASELAIRLLNRGVAPRSLWDGIHCAAAELLLRRRSIVPLHAVTTANAMHFLFRAARDETTRRLLLLQAAAFMPLFRGPAPSSGPRLDALEPAPVELAAVFEAVSTRPRHAAPAMLGYLAGGGSAAALAAGARAHLVRRGRGPHAYKLVSAVLEDHMQVSPAWRDRYLAATAASWVGSGSPEHPLVARVEAALAAKG